MTADQKKQIPSTPWQAESLRFTVLPSPSAEISEPCWWKDLTGEIPEARVSTPRRGIFQEEGPFDGGKLTLRIQLMRIDWLLNPTGGQQEDAFPIIGPFSESLTRFLGIMDRWVQMETFPPVKRIALGAVLLQPVENRRLGYQRLSTYLPAVQIDTGNVSDLLYQINRPRPSTSGISGLRINRLSTWSVALWQAASVVIGPESVDHKMEAGQVACRLELDVNTAPDFPGPLPADRLPVILSELADLAKEVAKDGDIP